VNLNGGEQLKSIGEPYPRASPDLVIDVGAIAGKVSIRRIEVLLVAFGPALRSSLSGFPLVGADHSAFVGGRIGRNPDGGLHPFPDCRPLCRLRSSKKARFGCAGLLNHDADNCWRWTCENVGIKASQR
jgi:hypothetical protein